MRKDDQAGAVLGAVSAFRLVESGVDCIVLSAPVRSAPSARLSPAEREVATAIVAGASNREIAAQRGTSERTVANQVAGVLRKFAVGSRAQLAATLGADRRPSLTAQPSAVHAAPSPNLA